MINKFYHGTSDVINIKNVLLPPQITNILREDFRVKLLDFVFLTVSLRSAEAYAKKACKKYGGNPVVYIARPKGNFVMNGIECICKSANILGVAKKY